MRGKGTQAFATVTVFAAWVLFPSLRPAGMTNSAIDIEQKGWRVAKECPPGFRSDTKLMNQLMSLFDVTLADVKSDWMDLMTKRLFAELNRQLCQVESEKKEALTSEDRVQNARVLATLQTTMERLARMEAKRNAHRKGKTIATDADLRKSMERKLDSIAAAKAAALLAQKSEQR